MSDELHVHQGRVRARDLRGERLTVPPPLVGIVTVINHHWSFRGVPRVAAVFIDSNIGVEELGFELCRGGDGVARAFAGVVGGVGQHFSLQLGPIGRELDVTGV